MNHRLDRINSEIQKSIADIIANRVKNPHITEMVSVLRVDTAKDLKTAKVYVSIYGDEHRCEITFNALTSCAGFIRHELSVDFKELRVVPQLTFIRDTSQAYSEKINAILEGLKND